MPERMDAAIRFDVDAYDTSQSWLMGRQAAGEGFLRAAVAGRLSDQVVGYGADRAPPPAFDAMVKALDPAATTRWIGLNQLDALSAFGVCYLPRPILGPEARLRLRVGPARHSLCGVTHTTATNRAMEGLAGLLKDPLMPWDAVICTSAAVADTARQVLDAESDYLKWRFGPEARIAGPQMPVIPLGVHVDDFRIPAQERAAARAAMGVADDEVVLLFVGRLAFYAKAHPFQMYQAAQAARLRTGAPVTLVQCGWSPNAPTEAAFHDGARAHCPDVRALFVDGRDAEQRRRSWAAADVFVSLSDNIQETFGLTPIEAMAAGLPSLVTDWNGYRDTVRHGVDGFRIATWGPAGGHGDDLALGHEAGLLTYDRYIWRAASSVSVELAELTDRLCDLVGDAGLRERMGAAARQRAAEVFDWSVVFGRYQELWAELNARRLAVNDDSAELQRLMAAPRVASTALDPFVSFGQYPTHPMSPETTAVLAQGASLARFDALQADVLFSSTLNLTAFVRATWPAMETAPLPIGELARLARCSPSLAVQAVGLLAKMGIVTLRH